MNKTYFKEIDNLIFVALQNENETVENKGRNKKKIYFGISLCLGLFALFISLMILFANHQSKLYFEIICYTLCDCLCLFKAKKIIKLIII